MGASILELGVSEIRNSLVCARQSWDFSSQPRENGGRSTAEGGCVGELMQAQADSPLGLGTGPIRATAEYDETRLGVSRVLRVASREQEAVRAV